MNVHAVTRLFEAEAPLVLKESYDNVGLLIGNGNMEVKGVLIAIDITEAVIDEAIAGNFNLIVSHHPLIFGGLKKITGSTDVQRSVIKAIKHDIAIYAAHTNIDNVINGVSGRMADKLGLINSRYLFRKRVCCLN